MGITLGIGQTPLSKINIDSTVTEFSLHFQRVVNNNRRLMILIALEIFSLFISKQIFCEFFPFFLFCF